MLSKKLKEKAKAEGKNAAINTVIYFLLITIGFVYLYPLIYMIITSLMTTEDLINPTIMWVPTKIDFSNFEMVWSILRVL